MQEKNVIKILSELVEIKSISSAQEHQDDVMKSAQYVELSLIHI